MNLLLWFPAIDLVRCPKISPKPPIRRILIVQTNLYTNALTAIKIQKVIALNLLATQIGGTQYDIGILSGLSLPWLLKQRNMILFPFPRHC